MTGTVDFMTKVVTLFSTLDALAGPDFAIEIGGRKIISLAVVLNSRFWVKRPLSKKHLISFGLFVIQNRFR